MIKIEIGTAVELENNCDHQLIQNEEFLYNYEQLLGIRIIDEEFKYNYDQLITTTPGHVAVEFVDFVTKQLSK